MPNNPTELIAGCLGDDPAAQSALFEHVKGLIYRTAYLMSGSAQDAEDALQEVFMRVLRFLGTYDPSRGAFSTWVYRITVNYCLAEKQASRRGAAVALDADLPAADGEAGGDPLAAISLAEQANILLGALSDDQRAVAILRFYWDLSYKEIAEIMGIEVGTVQSRLGRAVKKMRAVMNSAQEVH